MEPDRVAASPDSQVMTSVLMQMEPLSLSSLIMAMLPFRRLGLSLYITFLSKAQGSFFPVAVFPKRQNISAIDKTPLPWADVRGRGFTCC